MQCLQQLLRHRRVDERPHQVDPDDGDHTRQDHAPDGIDQPHFRVDEEQGKGDGGDRHEQGGHDEEEECVGPAEAEPREAITRKGGEYGRADRTRKRVEDRVPEPIQEDPRAAHVLPEGGQVLEKMERAGEPEPEAAVDIGLRLGGVDQQPDQRRQDEDREEPADGGERRAGALPQPVQLRRDLVQCRLSRSWAQPAAHRNSPLRRRSANAPTEISPMINASTTAAAAPRLYSPLPTAVL